jgi:predicted AlkP superfamily phosphohydrolase/phosphomutase
MNKAKMIRILNEPGFYVGSLWPTIVTGSSVATHGRYCWRQLRAGQYEDEFFQIDQIRGEPIWERLEKKGFSVCVIDIPKSLPGPHFRGRFVKDWGTHDPSTGGFQISGWMTSADFRRRYGTDQVGHCDAITRTPAGYLDFRDKLMDRISARTRIVRDVLSEGATEALIVSFSEAHCAGHQCWHLHDSGHEMFDSAVRDEVGDPICDVYHALDLAVGEVVTALNPSDTLMLIATHGMGANHGAAELLNALVADFEFDALDSADQNALRSHGAPDLLSLESAEFRRRLRVFPVPNNGAYAAFRLNIVGREPEGRLAPGDADSFLREFHERLLDLRNPDTGEKLFISSVFPRDAYSGPLSVQLPDLLLEWNRSSAIKRVRTPRSTLWNTNPRNPRTGDHRPDGGLWVLGPDAEKLFRSTKAIRTPDLCEWILRLSDSARTESGTSLLPWMCHEDNRWRVGQLSNGSA